ADVAPMVAVAAPVVLFWAMVPPAAGRIPETALSVPDFSGRSGFRLHCHLSWSREWLKAREEASPGVPCSHGRRRSEDGSRNRFVSSSRSLPSRAARITGRIARAPPQQPPI